MAQTITSDAALAAIFKTYYTGEKLQNLLYRNSPLLQKLKKENVTGKEYAFAALYTRNASTSGDYTKAVANAANSGKNVEIKVQPGKMFTVYNVNQLEKLGSKEERGAYISATVNRFFAACEGTRRDLAAAMYGSGYGELGQIPTAVSAGDTTMTLDPSTIIKMDVGTKFQVTSTVLPSGALVSGGPFTVTAVNGNVVTFTPVAPVGGFIQNAWIEVDGGRDSGGAPNYPTGLAGWIPSIADRTGATWDSYIATPFYGMNRSDNVDAKAGSFYKRDSGNNEKYSSAINKGIRLVRRRGGVPNLIVVNDEDYLTIAAEIEASTSYWQSINSGDKKAKNEVVKGVSQMSFAFSTSFIQYVVDDPFCPKGTAYILDEDAVRWITLSSIKVFDTGISGNEPGKASVDSDGDTSFNYELLIDNMLDVRPASDTPDGPGARVSLSLYGNLVVLNPSSCAVIKF